MWVVDIQHVKGSDSEGGGSFEPQCLEYAFHHLQNWDPRTQNLHMEQVQRDSLIQGLENYGISYL